MTCPICGLEHAANVPCSTIERKATGTAEMVPWEEGGPVATPVIPPPAPSAPLPGLAPDAMVGTTLGSFKIIKVIGKGGMGTVYLGEQTMIGSKVAIKILHDHLAGNPSLVARFYAEAKAVNLIGHENIVNIFDMNLVPPNRYYLIMELLEGRALNTICKGPIDPEIVVPILVQVCDGLDAAHAHGVVHRDLKPENIFLIRRGRNENFAKILDFGIAKLFATEAGSESTAVGMIVGTPEYMAPEQTTGEKIDGRADIYALGVIAYLMLTGRLPFSGGGLTGLLLAHQTKMAIPPHQLNARIPLELSATIMRALAKRVGDRFQTAGELAAALEFAIPPAPLLSRGQLTTPTPSPSAPPPRPSEGSAPTPAGAARPSSPGGWSGNPPSSAPIPGPRLQDLVGTPLKGTSHPLAFAPQGSSPTPGASTRAPTPVVGYGPVAAAAGTPRPTARAVASGYGTPPHGGRVGTARLGLPYLGASKPLGYGIPAIGASVVRGLVPPPLGSPEAMGVGPSHESKTPVVAAPEAALPVVVFPLPQTAAPQSSGPTPVLPVPAHKFPGAEAAASESPAQATLSPPLAAGQSAGAAVGIPAVSWTTSPAAIAASGVPSLSWTPAPAAIARNPAEAPSVSAGATSPNPTAFGAAPAVSIDLSSKNPMAFGSAPAVSTALPTHAPALNGTPSAAATVSTDAPARSEPLSAAVIAIAPADAPNDTAARNGTAAADLPVGGAASPAVAGGPPTRVAARVRQLDGKDLGEMQCQDITKGGCFFNTDGAVPALFARVKISFPTAGQFECIGEVVRQVTAEQATAWSMSPGFGVQFVALTTAQKDALGRVAQGLPSAPLAELANDEVAEKVLAEYRKRLNGDPYLVLSLEIDAELSEVRARGREARRELERLRERPVSSDQKAQIEAAMNQVASAVEVLGSAQQRIEFDAQRGNYKGVARCISAGLTVTEIEKVRTTFLSTRQGVEIKGQVKFFSGNAYESNNQLAKAVESYEEALALDPLNLRYQQRYWALKRKNP